MGLTRPRAEQIFNLDYKQATRAVAVDNITLTGGAPSQVDGVSLGVKDRILVTGQSTASQNGLYYVSILGSGSNGTWARTNDTNETGEIEAGMIVMATEGMIYADTQWKLVTNNPIVIDVTPLIWSINILSTVGGGNTQVQYNSSGTLGASPNFTFDGSNVSVAGDVVAGNIISSGDITGKNLNSSNADLAEMYVSDADYPAGTVVEFGGNYEITATQASHSTAVAGIVSTNPSYLMNSIQAGQHVLPVALIGRVPCQVIGTVAKGDRMVAGDLSGVAQRLDLTKYQPGCIVGKALENYNSNNVGIIELAVGRF